MATFYRLSKITTSLSAAV